MDKAVNAGKWPDTFLLDCSKPYKKVNHQKLLLKLDHYGKSGELCNWKSNYYELRTKTCVLKSKYKIFKLLNCRFLRKLFWEHFCFRYASVTFLKPQTLRCCFSLTTPKSFVKLYLLITDTPHIMTAIEQNVEFNMEKRQLLSVAQ